MGLTTDQIDTLIRHRAITKALEDRNARNWLAVTYADWLYGGWTRDDGEIAKPHYKAIKLHEACKDRRINTFACFGGNQSLRSLTTVWDEGKRSWRKIGEILEPFMTLSWDGSAFAPAMAFPYPAKPRHKLLRVSLRSGRSFDATPGHRVLGADGDWCRVEDLRPGVTLRGLDLRRLHRRSGPSLQASGAMISAPLATETAIGSVGGYRERQSSGGEQPQPLSMAGQGPWQRSPDAVAYLVESAVSFRVGRQASMRNGGFRHGDRVLRTRCCGVDTGEIHAAMCSQSALQSTHGFDLLFESNGESSQWAIPDGQQGALRASAFGFPQSLSQRQSSLQWLDGSGLGLPTPEAVSYSKGISAVGPHQFSVEDEVVSITPAGSEVNYDLWVPGYENFVAEGVVHHNSSKSTWLLSEFCAEIRGERPWDGSKTSNPGPPRDHLLAGPSFSKHFPLTLNPYFEQRMGDWIVDSIKSQQKNTVMYMLKNGDRVHCLSYEQYLKIGRNQTNPFEGPRWWCAAFDEPPPEPVWNGTMRGLVRSLSAGGGRAFLACTPLQQPWIFNRLYEAAGNRGGANQNIYATEFTMWDNPSLTDEAIERFAQGLSSEEKEARLYGRFRHLTGRVFPEFSEETHVFSETDPNHPFDPLVKSDGTPTDWPIIMAIDPHTRRPPFMTWAAVSPMGDLYFVRECPTVPFETLRSTKGGMPRWAADIKAVEETLPGGPARVLYRVMDPRFGGQASESGSEVTVQKAMRKLGYFFRTNFTRTGEASLQARHNLVKAALEKPDPKAETSEVNRPALFVSKDNCRNIIHAFLSYIYDEWADMTKGAKEKPQEYMKDPMDCVGFTMMSRPRHVSWENRGANVQGQRDMLVARMNGMG